MAETRKQLRALRVEYEVVPFSAETGLGVEPVQARLADWLELPDREPTSAARGGQVD
jgi:hypothetical protein